MSEQRRYNVIVPLFKDKENSQYCDNYRASRLMSHTMNLGKSWWGETNMGAEQFGFMPIRRTVDVTFAAKQLMEKHREIQKEQNIIVR